MQGTTNIKILSMCKTVMENDKHSNANITCNLASVYVKVVIESE